jgi:signal transduction histidine kinase
MNGERKGWGLMMMKERAIAAGDSFSVKSRTGQGAQVAVEIRR